MKVLIALSLIAIVLISGCMHTTPTPPAAPAPTTPSPAELATQGKDLFSAKGCVGCHRNKDFPTGGTIGPSLDGVSTRLTDDALRTVLKEGRLDKGMPNLGLTDKEVDALMSYLKTLK